MPPYSIPRRPFPVQDNEKPIRINWRRGMLRVWILISAAWLMGWTIQLTMYGLQGGFKVAGDFIVIPVLLFGPPVALLVFGVAAGWAFRGFRVEDAPKRP